MTGTIIAVGTTTRTIITAGTAAARQPSHDDDMPTHPPFANAPSAAREIAREDTP
jgi:hypothetical protein